MNNPVVSVVMSVYNGESYLREAVDSIINQTFTDYEFIIINDGSIDKTKEIIESYSDSRIRLFNQKNIGLTKSLNKGIALARGKYIARMDADDISTSDRFEKQVRFLNENPNCIATGTWCKWIDSNGEVYSSWEPPTSCRDIREQLFVNNCIVHGSVMLRRFILTQTGGYNEKYAYAQDYDLWLRLFEIGKIQNIGEYLYNLRSWSGTISTAKKEIQDKYATLALQERLQRKKYTERF